jgi:hypothetical protein
MLDLGFTFGELENIVENLCTNVYRLAICIYCFAIKVVLAACLHNLQHKIGPTNSKYYR